MTGRRATQGESLLGDRRERLRRAAEDGERLYRVRMHGEPTIADDNRINGILTLDLQDALGLVERLLANVETWQRTAGLAASDAAQLRGRPATDEEIWELP